MFANLRQNEDAVSPIVATLVLIVVAVVGAVAVGTIMGTFSSDVGTKVNSDDVSNAVGPAGEVLIAGSTTVQPVSELLAEAFMADHPGTRITVQGGGSGAGVTSIGMGIVDIGAASRNMKDTEATKYDDLVAHPIGGSIVVAIVPAAQSSAVDTFEDEDTGDDALVDVFNETSSDTTWTPVTREEESGTEDSFVEWCKVIDSDFVLNESVTKTGNQGVVDYVASQTGKVVGFCDYSYAKAAGDSVHIVMINGEPSSEFESDAKKLVTAYITSGKEKATGCTQPSGIEYPVGLARVLNYITGPNTGSTANAFIDFATTPGALDYFHQAGYWGIVELQ